MRRRLEPVLQIDVWEVKLDDEFLMSSMFTATEEAVGRLAMAATPGDGLRVVVGGLGLGYTAHAALEDPRIASLHVIEVLEPVIEWHRDGLVPLGTALPDDPRCELVLGDFFAIVDDGLVFDDGSAGGDGRAAPFDAILVDIDHTPSHHLGSGHEGFYTSRGLQRVADQLVAGGVFALWSDDPPDDPFLAKMSEAFSTVAAEVVTFPNHHTGADSACTVYLAHA